MSVHEIMRKTYNLLFVSTSYPTNSDDWRGVFISQLVHALAEEADWQLRILSPPGDFPDNIEYICTKKESEWLESLMSLGGIAHLYRQGGARSLIYAFRLLKLLRDVYKREQSGVDVIHVNWLQNIIPLSRGSQPLLITVLGADIKLLKLPGMKFMLRRVLKSRRCIVAPNAEWMVPVLQSALSDTCEIRHINFGIDERWYQVEKSRNAEKHKWIVVLRVTTKKIGMLFDWGRGIFSEDAHELHLFGPMQEQLDIPDWVTYHGAASPDELRDVWFPEASGLITLSEHDEGRPQVIMEAMASGLPVIASSITAHKNLIKHKETGWLCRNETDFINAINGLSEQEQNTVIGFQAREWMMNNVGTWGDCAHRYVNAYQDLLGIED